MNARVVKMCLWALLLFECVMIVVIRAPWIATDSHVYLRLAAGIEQTGFARFGFFYDGQFFPERIRPPGYPYILATLVYALHIPHVGIVVLQMVLFAGSIAMLASIARSYNRELQFLGLCILCPFPTYYSGILMTEPWAIFCTTLVFFLLARHARALKSAQAIAIGVTCAAAALIRSNLILVLFITLAAIVISAQRLRIKSALLVGAAAALTLVPFMVRNYQEFRMFSPLQPTPSGGSSLYQAVWQRDLEGADMHGYVHEGKHVPELESIGFAAQNSAMNRALGVRERIGLSAEHYPVHLQMRADESMKRAALARIREQPLAYAMHVVLNLFQLGNPRSYPAATPRAVEIVLRVIMAAVWFAGLLALVIKRRAAPYEMRLATFFIFAFLTTLMWFVTEPRYMSPVLLLVYLNVALLLPRSNLAESGVG